MVKINRCPVLQRYLEGSPNTIAMSWFGDLSFLNYMPNFWPLNPRKVYKGAYLAKGLERQKMTYNLFRVWLENIAVHV